MEYFSQAMNNIRNNKLKAVLTMLGIVIGVAAVIAVLSIGMGGREMITNELEQFGINRFWIYANTTKNNASGVPLTTGDVEVLRSRIGYDDVCPAAYVVKPTMYQSKSMQTEIVGTDSVYRQVWNIGMQNGGRFITDADNTYEHMVVVLSQGLAKELFQNADPIGKMVVCGGKEFKVIGVQADSGQLAQQFSSERAYIPLSIFQRYFGSNAIDEISITASSAAQIDAVGEEALKILLQKNGEQGVYRSFNLSKEMQLAENILNTFTLIIAAVAVISLLIAGIGIMNIMLVSVKERTQEIGIKKALGAKNNQILLQFLAEAVTYSLLGGAGGIVLGVLFTHFFAQAIHIPIIVEPVILLLSALFAVAVGMFFGIYPARRAAKLDPVEALRKE
ncbi:ABC transporter permease [Clostridia bacterium OttesenSCG-928-F22]|nr:ABC transporter permease [Clostridia bacterium OttesenSCG-928-F22]